MDCMDRNVTLFVFLFTLNFIFYSFKIRTNISGSQTLNPISKHNIKNTNHSKSFNEEKTILLNNTIMLC